MRAPFSPLQSGRAAADGSFIRSYLKTRAGRGVAGLPLGVDFDPGAQFSAQLPLKTSLQDAKKSEEEDQALLVVAIS